MTAPETAPSAPVSVAVLYGGRSPEHSISCVSAGSVLARLDPKRFRVVPIGITRAGTWVRGETDPTRLAIIDGRLPEVAADAAPVALSVDPATAGRIVDVRTGAVFDTVDVVLPMLHGPGGEDGTVQGMLELSRIPYVGAGVFASAATMDKEYTKRILGAAGLPIGDQVVLKHGERDLDEAARLRLGLPVFVKPARGGSSIGITRVADWAALPAAIDTARELDPKVIVEAELIGREVECGVLEFPDGTVRAGELAALHVPAAEATATAATADTTDGGDLGFYDFETKYLADVITVDLPARIPADSADEIRRLAIETFHALDIGGLARVDFFLTADGPVVNEANTLPGCTPSSMFPQMWEAAGLAYADMLAVLVDTALATADARRAR